MIVDGSIATLYVDGVALNARMYARPGQALALYVVDGELNVSNATLAQKAWPRSARRNWNCARAP
ncbi:MAG: hypothetical protein R2838_06640 [Caldilineaceae bacterium]